MDEFILGLCIPYVQRYALCMQMIDVIGGIRSKYNGEFKAIEMIISIIGIFQLFNFNVFEYVQPIIDDNDMFLYRFFRSSCDENYLPIGWRN